MSPLSAQTKLLLIAFSSVLVLVLIGAAVYKGWYTNPISTYTQAPPITIESDHSESFIIKLTPSTPTARVGETITYSLIPAQSLTILGISLKMDVAEPNVQVSNIFTVLLDNPAEVLINSISSAEAEERYAEMALITMSPEQNPIQLIAGNPIATIDITASQPSTGSIMPFSLDSESSMITLFTEESAVSLELDIEPVVITE